MFVFVIAKRYTSCCVYFYCFNVQNPNQSVIRCVGGKKNKYTGTAPFSIDGKYAARVRAITPAGNGSWSNTVSFSLLIKEESVGEFTKNW